MSADIVFSTTEDWNDTSSAVNQSSLVHNVTGGTYNAIKLYITNVGDTAAINCGFYIKYAGTDPNAKTLTSFDYVLSWANSDTHGVHTVQGTAEIAAFEIALGAYTNVEKLHSHTRGIGPANSISLKDADGTGGNELTPIVTGGSTMPFYIFVKIPAGANAGQFDYELHFYYEEVV
tara:strand:- start:65204 stop:65731 length:528 start_codon:yes stop_codon:yes gene_type:complete